MFSSGLLFSCVFIILFLYAKPTRAKDNSATEAERYKDSMPFISSKDISVSTISLVKFGFSPVNETFFPLREFIIVDLGDSAEASGSPARREANGVR